jgi:hypothetical protein
MENKNQIISMKKVFTSYLEKHKPFTSFKVGSIIKTSMVVVIPVYLEDKLESTLLSLLQCHRPQQNVAVLLVVNASVNASEEIILQQKDTIAMLSKYSQGRSEWLHFYAVEAFNLPKKHFGAGLARKIGMDLAVQYFSATENEDGIIVSLDADTTVDQNYFEALYDYFKTFKHNACSIYFEHPIDGDLYEDTIYAAITQYELHLRYYVESLRMIGFPYAFHTIGSCFATTAEAYVKVGGMNRRQGGEEFYFIQKLIQLGGYGELNNTVVHPSPRISDRVPFGTGPSVKSIVQSQQEYLTYHLQGFLDLKVLFDHIEDYYKISEESYQQEILKLPGRVRSFLLNSDFWDELSNLMGNCSSLKVFRKRFYEVFNAFKLVKYINYIHEHFVEKTPVFDAALDLIQQLGYDSDDYFEEKELLQRYRELQRMY